MPASWCPRKIIWPWPGPSSTCWTTRTGPWNWVVGDTSGCSGTLPGGGRRKRPWRPIERPSMITVDFSRLPVSPGARILDIGCGSGRHTCAAYRLKGVQVTGADLNPNDLKEARGRLNFMTGWANMAVGSGAFPRPMSPACPFPTHALTWLSAVKYWNTSRTMKGPCAKSPVCSNRENRWWSAFPATCPNASAGPCQTIISMPTRAMCAFTAKTT
jgi:hypothetical protein